MGWIKRLIDRLIFTSAAVTGLQLPGFIQAYLQRLGGHLDEASAGLSQWQQVADEHHGGDLAQLIDSYLLSQDAAVRDSGQLVKASVARVEQLQQAFSSLQDGALWQQIVRLPLHMELSVAEATWQQYQWTVPLDTQALLLGGLFALLVTGLLRGAAHLISKPLAPKSGQGELSFR